MHNIAKFLFWATLILFGSVLIFASYIGVYLTYIAIPVIIISGAIMKLTKPKFKKELGPFGEFFSEAKAYMAKEADDAKEMIRLETEYVKKLREDKKSEEI